MAARSRHVRRSDLATALLTDGRSGEGLDHEEAERKRPDQIGEEQQAGRQHGATILATNTEAPHDPLQCRSVDRRVSIERVFHLCEQFAQTIWLDETVAEHGFDIRAVFSMATFELGQALRVEI